MVRTFGRSIPHPGPMPRRNRRLWFSRSRSGSFALLFWRHFRAFLASFRQTNSDGLFAALGLATFAAPLFAALGLADRFLDFALRLFAVLCHKFLLVRLIRQAIVMPPAI